MPLRRFRQFPSVPCLLSFYSGMDVEFFSNAFSVFVKSTIMNYTDYH